MVLLILASARPIGALLIASPALATNYANAEIEPSVTAVSSSKLAGSEARSPPASSVAGAARAIRWL